MDRAFIRLAANAARMEGVRQCNAQVARGLNERNFDRVRKHLSGRAVFTWQRGNERPVEVRGAVKISSELKEEMDQLDAKCHRPVITFANTCITHNGAVDEEGVATTSQLTVYTTPAGGVPGTVVRSGTVHDEYDFNNSTHEWEMTARHVQYDE